MSSPFHAFCSFSSTLFLFIHSFIFFLFIIYRVFFFFPPSFHLFFFFSLAISKVIARDRLTSCLLEEAREKYPDAITFRFDVECTGAKWLELQSGGDKRGATLALKNASDGETSELTAEFVVAADGVKSAIRDGLEADKALTKALSGGRMRVKRFPRKNEFAYKVVPFKLDAGWR